MSRWIALALLSTTLALNAQTGPVLVPNGLAPGDQYRLVFVTADSYGAADPNLADYNTLVNAEANASPLADLGATWYDIGSTGGESALTNVPADPHIPIYNLAGQLVASDATNATGGLFSGSIFNPIDINEYGDIQNSLVWTGSDIFGDIAFDEAFGFGSIVSAGNDTYTNGGWLAYTLYADHSPLPLYAISGILTVPAASGTNNPLPVIANLSPTSAPVGSSPLTLTINGTGFISTSAVTFNGIPHVATFVSSSQLTIALNSSDLATAGTFSVVVTNPPPGGGSSQPFTLTVSAPLNPTPTITSLSPSSAAAGSSSVTLTINGTGFLSTSLVIFNGVPHAATFVSSSQLTITLLTASDLSAPGTLPVVVTNPAPGGGPSNSVNFSVTPALNPTPTITSLSPSSAPAGSNALTLTISGSGFLSNSTVTYKGVAHAAALVILTPLATSASQLTITLTASDLAIAGSFPVVVTNPIPGGGSSQPVNFAVTVPLNPAPSITGLSPTTAPAGSSPLTLTINGTGFIGASAVTFNGVAHAATLVNSSQLTITLSASDLSSTGTFLVVVTNSSPGGGSSNPVNFTVTPAVPSINAGGVVSSADFTGPVSPGSIASVFGTFQVSSSSSATETPLPNTLSGLSMHFSGIAVPLLYASPGQANVQIPFELTGQTQTLATATVNSQTSAPQTIQLAAFAPGIFTTNAQGQGAILNTSNQLVDSTNPAIAGTTYIQIFCTGLGPVTNQPASGAAAPASPLAMTTTVPTLTVGGLPAIVSFYGLAPTAVGLYQVNAQVPSGVPSGSALPVILKIGGATSNTVTIAVQGVQPPNPQPTISGLSPSSVAAGSPAVVLTINGTGFIGASAVTFNGVAHAATLVNSSQLTITLSASDLSVPGTFLVVVTNPSPGGGTSQPFNFTVSIPPNPQPKITSLSPSSAQPGSSPLTLTINGTGFLSASSVTFNGISHAVSFQSSSQLTITLTASDLATAGSFAVVVNNPPPGGGSSAPFTFTVAVVSQTLTFNVGAAPVALVSDGTNIWVANSGGNSVTKLRISDGSTVGTYAAGLSPNALVFDGSSIWVANAGTMFVTRLRATDGSLLSTTPAVLYSAAALTFDGSNIWVTDAGISAFAPSFITKLRGTDGYPLAVYQVGVKPFAATFDGANIWVANSLSDTLTELRASDGTILGTFNVGVEPSALVSDGSNMWVANAGINGIYGSIMKLRQSDGTLLGTATDTQDALGLAFDGANIWITGYLSNTVSKLNAQTGNLIATFPVQKEPIAVLFDGNNIWVANSASNTVTEITNQSPN